MKGIIKNIALSDILIAISNLVMLSAFILWIWLTVTVFCAHPNFWWWCLSSLFFLTGGTVISNYVHIKMKKALREGKIPMYLYFIPQTICSFSLSLLSWWLQNMNYMFFEKESFRLIVNSQGLSLGILAILSAFSGALFTKKEFSS